MFLPNASPQASLSNHRRKQKRIISKMGNPCFNCCHTCITNTTSSATATATTAAASTTTATTSCCCCAATTSATLKRFYTTSSDTSRCFSTKSNPSDSDTHQSSEHYDQDIQLVSNCSPQRPYHKRRCQVIAGRAVLIRNRG